MIDTRLIILKFIKDKLCEKYWWIKMVSRNKIFLSLVLSFLILISSISVVCAAMEIEGGAFYTDGNLDDLTYTSIDVGSEYAGDDVIIQIFYSRDGSDLNKGNMVPKTVSTDGFINVKSAESYKYFPDHAEIKIYDTNKNLLDSLDVKLSPSKGLQIFGTGTYDYSYINNAELDSSSTYYNGIDLSGGSGESVEIVHINENSGVIEGYKGGRKGVWTPSGSFIEEGGGYWKVFLKYKLN